MSSIPQTCRFDLYIIRKIRPYFSEYATQLMQVLIVFLLHYCNAHLTGLPACAISPLQMIQNCKSMSHFTVYSSALAFSGLQHQVISSDTC